MKQFTVEQRTLCDILASMQPMCTKRTTVDATASLLFHVGYRELVIKGTDLEISLQASCPLQSSECAQPEQFLVNGKRIFDIVKELEGTITCGYSRGQLSIKAGGAAMSLTIKDAEEFPPFPERIENLMSVEASLLKSMLEGVAFIIPSANANPALNGLLLEVDHESLTMTATDGHCLSQGKTTRCTLPESKSWLMPRRAVFELRKILETAHDSSIFVGVCGSHLVFSGELFNFFTKLLGDKFPQYRQILDKTSFIAGTVDRVPFAKALKRSACLLSGQFLATNFGFAPHKLRISMNNKEVGTLDEEIPLTTELEPLDVRFYAPYVLNGLQAFGGEAVTFYLRSNTAPIMFEAEREAMTMTYLVMPVSPTSNTPV